MQKWIGAVIGMGVVVELAFAHPVLAQDAKKAEKQAAIRKEAQTTLDKLYKSHPGAESTIPKAAGYAAFDNFGMNLFLLSTAKGKGIAVEPPRVYRRLHSLRGWGHGKTEQIFSGGARARGADGVRAYPGTRVAVGGDYLDRREDRVCGGDTAALGATGRA